MNQKKSLSSLEKLKQQYPKLDEKLKEAVPNLIEKIAKYVNKIIDNDGAQCSKNKNSNHDFYLLLECIENNQNTIINYLQNKNELTEEFCNSLQVNRKFFLKYFLLVIRNEFKNDIDWNQEVKNVFDKLSKM